MSMGNTGTMMSTYDLEAGEDQYADVPVYEEYNALLHGASRKKTSVQHYTSLCRSGHCTLSHSDTVYCSDRVITVQFMRKYLNVAKKIVPELTREAADYIAEEYSKLRNQENLQGDLARVCSLFLSHL